jgi:hypothetical protein
MFVIHVLITATAAAAKVGTFGYDPVRRWLDDRDNFGLRKFFLLADNFRRDRLPIDGEGNEDGFATLARDTLAAESDVLDL